MDQEAINQAEWENPDNWTGPKWLSVYFSKHDSRLWMPKQMPRLGWTINLGRPGGLAWLVAIILGLPLFGYRCLRAGNLLTLSAVASHSLLQMSASSLAQRLPIRFRLEAFRVRQSLLPADYEGGQPSVCTRSRAWQHHHLDLGYN